MVQDRTEVATDH